MFRLSTYRVDIPPLRERREDIPLLCAHFLVSMASGSERPILTPGALAALELYSFPGNVRELRGLLLKAKAFCAGEPIGQSAIERLLAGPSKSNPDPAPSTALSATAPAPAPVLELPTIQEAIENLVDEALERTSGHQSAAAKLLGISPQALSQRLKHRGTEL